MDCRKAQILFAPHIMGDLEPGEERYRQLKAHLLSCQACKQGYEVRRQTIAFIEQNKAVFAEALMTPQEREAAEQQEIKRSWEHIDAKLNKIEAHQRQENRKSFQLFMQRIGAAAACLAIGILSWMVVSNYSKPQIYTQNSSPPQAAVLPRPFVRIELISENGIIPVPANQQIASSDELKTLLINGKHRMMMNTGTTLTVKPLEKNSNIGCLVRLASGQIYAHVEHDGNPFEVETANGRAVITGTIFDIKATDTGTTLIVTEGTVQFKSENGAVKVGAGQKSEIVNRAAPSVPVICNAAELTAWATGFTPEPALARAKTDTDTSGFSWPWPFETESTGLEQTDYNRWVREKRNWFKYQFPHIFQLQNAFAKEGIEVDYPKLLIQSGDPWQFAYTKTTTDKFSVLNFNSLFTTASDYGLDKRWLLDNVPYARYASEKPVLSENSLTVLGTFEKWNSIFEDAQKSCKDLGFDIQNRLFHASIYLANTRSLIWFAVKDGKYDLTNNEKAEVLALLQSQVNAASVCQDNVLYQPFKNKQACDPEVCKQNKWYQWVDIITRNINAITSAEEEIKEYEIGK